MTGHDEAVRSFVCPVCRALLSYENLWCVGCGTDLGYHRALRTLVPVGNAGTCSNRSGIGCNWLATPGLCASCRLTRVRPHDDDGAGLAAWALTETAKRRLIYQLDDFGLPTTSRTEDPDTGLAFDLLSSRDEVVTTGHADGVITIDMAEGDDVHRESVRIGLGETYRTMLGHLRHEIGHWYWQVLIDGTDRLEQFRSLFGDERADYAQALKEHYGKDDDRSWAGTHISRYAASHAWEDWAESFAHYLHIRDTLQTAAAWRVHIGGPFTEPAVLDAGSLDVEPVDGVTSFDAMVATWLPVSFLLNAVNRSLGHPDAYAFVLVPPVLDKLRFVHETVTA